MIKVLLDTSVCIELIRGRSQPIQARLRRRKIGTVGISSITLAELQHGVAKSSDPQRNTVALAHFTAPIEVCPFDNAAASAYGRIRAQLERSGTPIGPLDTLIAAHAVALDVPIVTWNERELERVQGLRVETWR